MPDQRSVPPQHFRAHGRWPGLASLPARAGVRLEQPCPEASPPESPILLIAGLVALRLAWGLCCVWLERSQRKTTLAVLDKLLAWEHERRQK